MRSPSAERVRFRLYTEADRDLFILLMTDTVVMKHVGDGPLGKEAASELWRKLLFEFYPNGRDTIWALETIDGGKYLGHASIRPRPDYTDEWEIGYILKKEEWGKGLATEAASALVEFGFSNLGLKTIFATVDDDNIASIRVLSKAGLSFLRVDHDAEGRYSVYATGGNEQLGTLQ